MSRTAPDLSADRARALALVPVSRETLARLDRFVDLLLQWQRTTNLIGPATVSQLWTRHIADSLQLLALAPDAQVWVDLGSGGGFPGLVIACTLVEKQGVAVHLVESNAKKAAFLREVVRDLCLPAVVHGQRIEHFSLPAGTQADVITARALAPLTVLFGYVAPLLKTGAQALLLKGQDVEAELTEASKYWSIQADLVPSKTSPGGRIVVVRRLARKNARM
jgi:16S rRNA (guanine527-N7)-methyltransferase